MEDDIIKALQDAGIKTADIPLVAGLAVFVLFALLFLAFRALSKSSGSRSGPDNPWIVSDGPPPPDIPNDAKPPPEKVANPPSAKVPNLPALVSLSLDEVLGRIGAGPGFSQQREALEQEMRAMMARGGKVGKAGATVSTSFSRNHDSASFTTVTPGSPSQTYTLDDVALARARQMSKEGASTDAICRELLKEYASLGPLEQESLQRLLRGLLQF